MKKIIWMSRKKTVSYGPELYQTGIISDLNGGIMTFITGGINGTSDGTSGSAARPKITWSGLNDASSYRIIMTPTSNSGATAIVRFYNGAVYLIGTGSTQDELANEDFVFSSVGGASSLYYDGRETFDVDTIISLKEVL